MGWHAMRKGLQIGLGGLLASLGAAGAANGQVGVRGASAGVEPGAGVMVTLAGRIDAHAIPADRMIRWIEDRSLGNRWLLCRDPEHPGGPGRLLLIASNWREGVSSGRSGVVSATTAEARPVIRSGDRLVVEENSAVAQARLTAVALESAAAGSAFHARLEIGGRVLRAVAIAAGRAVFAGDSEVGP